ncbi:acyl-CoA carboxylase epsilon subunit [uncultured Jatrophihabitans sp.]|uniref:acyl-CoA carboxylase epsilon subunit n=1 Tax=uncultured Jatrophihabitans sp. TaxID=1610747 RepID=UPI0035C9F21C
MPDERHDSAAARPLLRVIGGTPTAEELAVVAAVVAAAAGGGASSRVQIVRRGAWNDPAHQHRRPLPSGPNGWRAAAQ